ncbi:MAG: hypothetical protein EOP85_11010 [Verrucomicrobiaceae bacterium]|nr:MAG: hypothetical protein EOP85_11010 [Verrucomicrobiaceae bacterium]
MSNDSPDTRLPVKPPIDPSEIRGLDVAFTFAGNFVSPGCGDASPARFTGSLTCSAPDEEGCVSVRLVTNHPLEDGNGREVYQVDLDQSSVDSLRRDRDSGQWTVRLPDLIRPVR